MQIIEMNRTTIFAFIDRATAYTGHGELTAVNFLYFELVLEITGKRWSFQQTFSEWVVSLGNCIKLLKKWKVCKFEEHCEKALSMMEVKISQHLGEDLDTFGSIKFLNALHLNSVK